MGSSSSQPGGFCECRDVVNKIINADAADDCAMQMVAGTDEMEAKPFDNVCKAVKVTPTPVTAAAKKQKIQARPKVEDKDGGSYQGEWLGFFADSGKTN
ncbi:RSPH1 [Symbiodinium natans]|uniref:RSPH1 protein n=1 Tax=Symbiodinium natans TaxID=878477 RepID=A0A812QD22_9DINO|nr:RSPH1 [Symbiodinium natans]